MVFQIARYIPSQVALSHQANKGLDNVSDFCPTVSGPCIIGVSFTVATSRDSVLFWYKLGTIDSVADKRSRSHSGKQPPLVLKELRAAPSNM